MQDSCEEKKRDGSRWTPKSENSTTGLITHYRYGTKAKKRKSERKTVRYFLVDDDSHLVLEERRWYSFLIYSDQLCGALLFDVPVKMIKKTALLACLGSEQQVT